MAYGSFITTNYLWPFTYGSFITTNYLWPFTYGSFFATKITGKVKGFKMIDVDGNYSEPIGASGMRFTLREKPAWQRGKSPRNAAHRMEHASTNPMTDPCMLYMVCHGSHQYILFMLALIYQHRLDPSWGPGDSPMPCLMTPEGYNIIQHLYRATLVYPNRRRSCPSFPAPRVQTRGWLIQKLASDGFADDSSDVPRVYKVPFKEWIEMVVS